MAKLREPFDSTREQLICVAYDDKGSNHIKHIKVNDSKFNNACLIATMHRLLFIDSIASRVVELPYSDIRTVDKPTPEHVTKDGKYTIHTRSGHAIELMVRFRTPGVLGSIVLATNASDPLARAEFEMRQRPAKAIMTELGAFFTEATLMN